jgi:hypothetical protein
VSSARIDQATVRERLRRRADGDNGGDPTAHDFSLDMADADVTAERLDLSPVRKPNRLTFNPGRRITFTP